MVAFITRFLTVNDDFLSSPSNPDGFTFDFCYIRCIWIEEIVFKLALSY